jgi:drug/metabolite transporter (DMT)-like permease
MSIAIQPAAGTTGAASLAAGVAWHRGALWAALTVVIWAAYPAVTRLGVTQTLAAGDLFALRFGVSALLLLPYLAWRAGTLPGGAWVKGIGLALCQGTLAGLAIVGLELAPARHASALIQGVIPAWLLIVGAAFLGQRFGRRGRWAVGLIAAGVAVVVADSGLASDERLLRGDLLFLLASLLACGYILQTRHYRLPPAATAAFVAVYCAVGFLPWYFLAGAHSFAQASASELVLQTVYQGVLIGGVSFIALNRAIAGLGCIQAGAFLSAVPVLSAIIAIPVLGEQPSLVDCAALVLITLGVGLASRASQKEAASPSP